MRAAVAGVLVLAAVGAQASTAAAVGEPGQPAWTLATLGRGEVELPVALAGEAVSVPFDAPAGTRQGTGRWYLGRLDFELERSTVDLLHGRREQLARTPRIAGSVRNFLQDRGLQAGSNTLAVRLERYGGARVHAARVLESTGVLGTAKGPAKLRLEVPIHDRSLRVGDEFAVPYRVINAGDRAPEYARVSAQFDRAMLAAVGPTTRKLDRSAPTSAGRFRFRARRAGRTEVLVGVRSTANRPGAQVSIRIDGRASGGGISRWWTGLGALGVLLLSAAVLVAFTPAGRRSGTAPEGHA